MRGLVNYTSLQIDARREVAAAVTSVAKAMLEPGDRIRVARCGGLLRTYTFVEWDGVWAVSTSGINDLHSAHIDRVNGVPVNFFEIALSCLAQQRSSTVIDVDLVRLTNGRLALVREEGGAIKGVTEQPAGDLTALCQRVLNGDETAMTKEVIIALAMDRIAAEIEGGRP